jgi:hypothetical protein
MRKPKEQPARFGSIDVGETLLLREASRRLGWQRRQQADAIKMGLKAVVVGRQKVTTGAWIREFVERLAEQGGAADAE